MIVTCEECTTSFQLDEARIPASGAQVRCSKCKHAFFLPNPSASQSEAAHSVAEQAAEDSTAGVPAVASDPLAASSTASTDVEAEEEDWQFNEEVRIEGDDILDTDDDFGVGADYGDDLNPDALMAEVSERDIEADPLASSGGDHKVDDLDSVADKGTALEAERDPTESVRDESAFGSVDDFSSLMEDDDVAPVDLGGDLESQLDRDATDAPSAGVYASNGTSDDLGDPESWDLVGNDAFSVSKGAAAMASPSFQDASSGVDEDSDDSFYADEVRRESRLLQGVGSIVRGLGWIASAALVTSVLVAGLHGEWTRWAQTPQTVSMGALTAEATDASWIETSRSGFVLVVEGQVRNTGGSPLWPGQVRLALLDATGARLNTSALPAGTRLSDRILRESSPTQLLANQSQAASRLRDTPLAPGESRAFFAIALEDQLPEAARRVLLEISEPLAAPSAPATQADRLESPAVEALQAEDESDLSP